LWGWEGYQPGRGGGKGAGPEISALPASFWEWGGLTHWNLHVKRSWKRISGWGIMEKKTRSPGPKAQRAPGPESPEGISHSFPGGEKYRGGEKAKDGLGQKPF